MAKTKRNLSLEDKVLKKGLKRAQELGFNFSTYVTYLINNDTKNLIIDDSEDLESNSEEEKNDINKISNDIEVTDPEALSEAENILNGVL